VKLRARMTLWFAGAAVVPIVAAGVVAWLQIASGTRAEVERALAEAHDDARRELERGRAAVVSAAEGARQSLLVTGLLFELAKGGELGPAQRRDLKQNAQATMKSLGLDVLTLVDQNDLVLAAPHFAAHVDEVDAEPRRVAQANAPVVAWARVLRGGKIARVLTVAAARTVSDRGHELTLLVGRELAADLLAPLHKEGVAARLTDATGADLVPPPPGAPPFANAEDLVLEDLAGKPIAHLLVAVSDRGLTARLHAVALVTLGLVAAAILAAVALGAFVSRRMTRDLDALLAGVQAVARGDLEHQVRVGAPDEVGRLAEAFNRMTREVQGANERLLQAERVAAWQDIAKSLAHEIKNPLTPIQMSVETMRKAWSLEHPSFTETFEESTRTILEEVQRLKKIVSEFSRFARMPGPERRPLDLNEIVASALALYQGAVRVVRELAPTLPPLAADRDQLTQVVLNLLENARDAVSSRGSEQSVGRITVRTAAREGAVELVVEDNGPGFDLTQKERLFQPYFTTKESGTGLGLAIVRRIVTDHGGRVSAESEPGRGARFTVVLPLVSEPPAS
jgi:signal transduction histidine kinase